MLSVLKSTTLLFLLEGEVDRLITKNGTISGVSIAGGPEVTCRKVVLCGGTFLRGTIYIGKRAIPGGRIGDPSSNKLAECLAKLGFIASRMKTGTPPRLLAESVDFDRMTPQYGENPPPFFSWKHRVQALFHVERHVADQSQPGGLFHVERSPGALHPWPPGVGQIPCYLTHTNSKTHGIISENLSNSALYGGMISGTGVRYCPSIEDKIVKFPHRDSHHVFIEPEGRSCDRIYPNGTSNSLPESVQRDMIRSIHGLERAVILRPGYAIEYDFYDPTMLTVELESKILHGLYFAGQVNGTTGYEEAAAQGFIAGINAARSALGRTSFTLGRDQAYIGVLIDDLVTKGVDEPYRMFTSRAENRLSLRQDNAVLRLTDAAATLGIVSDEDLQIRKQISADIEELIRRWDQPVSGAESVSNQILRGAFVVENLEGKTGYERFIAEQAYTEIKYRGYVEIERSVRKRNSNFDSMIIPHDIDYGSIKSLRTESRQKLSRIRPVSIGQASRIPGVGPADILLLAIWIKKTQISEKQIDKNHISEEENRNEISTPGLP